jgi:hypothetical protein
MPASHILYVAFGYERGELALIDIAGFDHERTKQRAAAFFGYDNYEGAFSDDHCIVLAYEPSAATERIIDMVESKRRSAVE